IGCFMGDLAVLHSSGSGEAVDGRQDVQDFGHIGSGFWFTSIGITVDNNIANDAFEGFDWYATGLIDNGVTTQFQSANLPDPSLAGGPTIDPQAMAFFPAHNNTVFASFNGVRVWRIFNHLSPTSPPAYDNWRAEIDGLTVWNAFTIGMRID